jgi:carboxypeptidase Q
MPQPSSIPFRSLLAGALVLALSPFAVIAQRGDADATLARIRAEGLERSSARALFLALTDGIGARLTGSPAHVRSANWARDRFAEWGLANPRLEPFEFGTGWELEHVSAAMTEPRYFPLIAYPEAWTPSTAGALKGRVVYLGNKTAAQVAAMGNELKGAIVLTHPPVDTFVERDRPQPGLENAPVATGNPSLPAARAPIPGRGVAPLRR